MFGACNKSNEYLCQLLLFILYTLIPVKFSLNSENIYVVLTLKSALSCSFSFKIVFTSWYDVVMLWGLGFGVQFN